MEFFDAVKNRYSHRTPFLKQPVPDEDIRKIVDAGIRAPSGVNAQTTSFVIVDDPALLARIAECFPTPAVKTAPVILVVLSENVITRCGLSFEVEDYASATVSMLLAATALGYATVWMDGMTRADQVNTAIRQILNVPETMRVRTVLPIGVPAETGTQNIRSPFEQRCTYNRFG